jgi:hypothetical protein
MMAATVEVAAIMRARRAKTGRPCDRPPRDPFGRRGAAINRQLAGGASGLHCSVLIGSVPMAVTSIQASSARTPAHRKPRPSSAPSSTSTQETSTRTTTSSRPPERWRWPFLACWTARDPGTTSESTPSRTRLTCFRGPAHTGGARCGWCAQQEHRRSQCCHGL